MIRYRAADRIYPGQKHLKTPLSQQIRPIDQKVHKNEKFYGYPYIEVR